MNLSKVFVWLSLALFLPFSEAIAVDSKLPSVVSQSQTSRTITGKVLDDLGDPLPGATIMIKKSTKGVVTDIDGNFTIQVNPRDYLVISYLGMETQEIPVSAQNTYIIKLQTAANKLEDVTIVAFGKQKKESVIASVTAVNPAELKVPSSNLTTALAGRMSGVISYQRSGEPGDDNAEFFIRGVTSFGYSQSPLILLDGFEISSADLARINPDDIARFSIMKDATATALYGARGANGVILVNTKEGEEGKIKISFRHETSLSMPTRLMKLADGVTYMNLYNQATFNKNEEYHPYYSAQKIQNTIDGINPYAFPNVNWYDELFEKNTINQRYNLNLSGGGKLAKYYLSANYSRDNGILQVDKRNNFNSNIAIDKFDLRTNINLNLTKTTKVNFKLNSKFERYNGPIKSGNDIFNSVMKSNPVDFPKYFIPVGSEIYTKHILFGSSNDGGVNPYADMVKGYKDSFTTNILAQFQVEQELDFITKGLSLRASANACSYSYYGSERSYDPYFYTLKDYNEIDGNYDIFQTKEGTESLGDPKIGKNANNRLYFEVAAQYSRQFFDKHDVGGLLVYTQTEALNTISSNKNTIFATLPSRNLGVAGRFSYGYDSRYMLEVNFGYNGSERFHKSNRYGFFPSFGLGYMISNEKFWSTCTRVVPKLKLKYTFGWVGNDAIADPDDRFFFMSEIVTNSEGYIYGKEFNGSFSGYGVKRFSNPDITWEISKKHNMGFEMNLFNIFDLNLDLFKEIRENIYMERETLPASMGLTAPVSNNMGRVDSKGVDWSVDVNHFFNKNFWISGRFNFTYATNKVIEKEEVAYKYPYLYRVGHPVNQQWGLVAERLFIDDNDVFNAPRQTWGATVGDIKYKDINNDGVVNNDDRVPIGTPTVPEVLYGFGPSIGFKGFDFSFFLQGSGRSSFFIDPDKITPFVNRANILDIIAKDHWTPESPELNTFWPRLSTTTIENNKQLSTWWLRDGRFLRIKSVELGYTFPEQWMKKACITKLRIYLTGNNLYCFSKFDLWDPEMGGNGLKYPLQRVYNVGLQLSF